MREDVYASHHSERNRSMTADEMRSPLYRSHFVGRQLWLGKLIEGERPRMMVVGKARCTTEALGLIREQPPNVYFLDVLR
jgi:hypothetical protein